MIFVDTMSEVAETSEMESVEEGAAPVPEKENKEPEVGLLAEDVTVTGKVEKTSFELAENVNSTEETDDESDDEAMETFLSLMNKAEKNNDKKKVAPGPMQVRQACSPLIQLFFGFASG